MPEEWGGKTVTVEVSAKKKQNIDLLLEMILLVSDIGELKANPKRNASGTVLEAKLDKGRGPVATVLVQDGTLQRRRHVHRRPDRRPRARAHRRPRASRPSRPDRRRRSKCSASPACRSRATCSRSPTRPRRGRSRRSARSRRRAGRSAPRASRLTLESLQAQIAEGGMKELPIIIKADVQGSAEVLADTLTKLTDEKVKIRIIHAGVGAVNESDVLLASASNAIIIAFNVRPDRNAEDIAARERVDIRAALGHLQRHRRDEEGDDGPARSDLQGSPDRRRRGAQHLQGAEVRHDRRLHGHRGPHHARRRHARRGCCATTSSSTRARSDRCAASRTM